MKIVLGTLKDKADDLVAFLEPRVGVKPAISGDVVEIDDEGLRKGVKPRDVKTYIKRFLFMRGVRENYRVFVQGRELTVQEIELGKEEKPEKEVKPKEREPTKQEKPTEPKEDEPKQEKLKKRATKKTREKKKGEAENEPEG